MYSLFSFIDLNQFSQSDLILVGIGAIIVIWILFKVAKTLFRVAIFALLIGALYFLWTGQTPSGVIKTGVKAALQKNNIADLHDKYCGLGKRDKALCACIFQPIYSELSNSYSESEIRTLEKDAMVSATMNAFNAQKEVITACIKEKKEDKLKIIEVLKEQIAN